MKKAEVLKIIFDMLKDSINDDDQNKIYLATGYAIACHNVGILSTADMGVMRFMLEEHEKYFGRSFRRGETQKWQEKLETLRKDLMEVFLV